MPDKVAVALSGGVDSTVTALILKDQGYDITGITMKLASGNEENLPAGGCYSRNEPERIEKTAAIAKQIGMPFKIIDCHKEFKKYVLDYVRNAYLAGETPNPCVVCNTYIKFGMFIENIKTDWVATGHYVRKADGLLQKAVDAGKDQSYFLYRLTPETISRLMFPLGTMKKTEIKEFARINGFKVADEKESQDFMDKDFSSLFCGEEKKGDILDEAGKKLGTHTGIFRFTVGQRRGIGGGMKEPMYVKGISAKNNTVTLAPLRHLETNEIKIRDTIVHTELPKWMGVKFRSSGKEIACEFNAKENTIHLKEKITKIAAGQSAVFYTAEGLVLGGGIVTDK